MQLTYLFSVLVMNANG